MQIWDEHFQQTQDRDPWVHKNTNYHVTGDDFADGDGVAMSSPSVNKDHLEIKDYRLVVFLTYPLSDERLDCLVEVMDPFSSQNNIKLHKYFR